VVCSTWLMNGSTAHITQYPSNENIMPAQLSNRRFAGLVSGRQGHGEASADTVPLPIREVDAILHVVRAFFFGPGAETSSSRRLGSIRSANTTRSTPSSPLADLKTVSIRASKAERNRPQTG